MTLNDGERALLGSNAVFREDTTRCGRSQTPPSEKNRLAGIAP